jgi:hypothetical protein
MHLRKISGLRDLQNVQQFELRATRSEEGESDDEYPQ